MLRANILNYVTIQHYETLHEMVEESKRLNQRDFYDNHAMFEDDDDDQAFEEDVEVPLITTINISCLRFRVWYLCSC